MFRHVVVGNLDRGYAWNALALPLSAASRSFSLTVVTDIVETTAGYPYFLLFFGAYLCRSVPAPGLSTCNAVACVLRRRQRAGQVTQPPNRKRTTITRARSPAEYVAAPVRPARATVAVLHPWWGLTDVVSELGSQVRREDSRLGVNRRGRRTGRYLTPWPTQGKAVQKWGCGT